MKTEESRTYGMLPVQYAIAYTENGNRFHIINDTITSSLNMIKDEFGNYDSLNHVIVMRNVTPWCEIAGPQIMKRQFDTYKELRSLMKRYIRYCYSISFKDYHYTKHTIDSLADDFVLRYGTKNDIVEYFQNQVFPYPKSTYLSPTSYYDLELKLSIRGFGKVNKTMVIDNKDLIPLHELTEEGKRNYNNFLEKRADEILYKSDHPFKYLFGKLLDFFGYRSN